MSDYIQIAMNRGNVFLEKDYIQLARITGHIYYDQDKMFKDDFYTLCQKNPKKNIGLRKQNKTHHMITFKSSDVDVDYLCSDFVRFCVSLIKNNANLYVGEMSLIPKQSIPISEELRDYIRDFLPDYYGIR
jgi:hypothetical protein